MLRAARPTPTRIDENWRSKMDKPHHSLYMYNSSEEEHKLREPSYFVKRERARARDILR